MRILRHRFAFVLIAIFCIGLFLRVHKLGTIPVGIHGDEASIGYNAYSLLKTGKDQNGNFLPLVIDQFGDFRPPGYHYLAVPFVYLFQLNEFAIRLPSALFGSALIILLFFFISELFNNKKIGIIASLFLALSPWHINISRATSEGVIAAFFILFGAYCFLKVAKTKQHIIVFSSIGALSFVLSFFFYHSARFFVPAFLLAFPIYSYVQYKQTKKQIFVLIAAAAVVFLSLFGLMFAAKGQARPLNVSIFNFPMGTYDLKQQIGQDGTQHPIITRFFHNKLFYYGRIFLSNYFKHIEGNFLFVENGLPIRYRVPWSGNLHIIDIPFLLFGCAVLLSEGIKTKKYHYLFLLVWLLVAAVPAGLTWEDVPNIQRSSLMIYALMGIIAFGIYELTNIKNKYILLPAIGIVSSIFLHNVLYFNHNYFHHSRIQEPWHRSAAVKEVVFTVAELSKEYSTIRMTTQGNNNLIHHLLYMKFDPKTFHALGSPKDQENLRFGNTIFTGNHCPLNGNPNAYATVDPGTVYINMPSCILPKNAEIIKTIRHPDGIPAYLVVKLLPIPINEL